MLPPSAGSRRDQPRLWRAEPCVPEVPFPNTSSLSLSSREKELDALKEHVNTLRASIAKEEEKVADLKLKVHLFTSGKHEADQVHAGIQARGLHTCTSGSSPAATSILGTEQTGFALGRDQHCFPGMELQQGQFGALLRQQTGSNTSAPCSCWEVGAGLACRDSWAAATCPRSQPSWEDETNRRMAQFSHLSLPLPLATQETNN